MQVYSSGVQSVFSKIFITRNNPKLIHGVRIGGSFFTGFDFFLCFYQTGRKGQCFIALWAENFFGQVISSYRSSHSFVTLFYHVTTSPLPSSVWYLQWRVQLSPSVFYSVYSVTGWPFACILCSVLEEGTVYVIRSTQMWRENQVSRVPGEVEHQETLFVTLYLVKSEF